MEMENVLTGIKTEEVKYPAPQPKPKIIPTPMPVPRSDILDIGQSAKEAAENAPAIVSERAIMRIRAVVEEARTQLGIPEGAELDTSVEGTATRIVDFATGLYDTWRENNAELGEEEARQRFADLIGGAVAQGVSEARDILSSLQALSPDIDQKVTDIADLVQQRIAQFAANS
jgi:hypothetical protein